MDQASRTAVRFAAGYDRLMLRAERGRLAGWRREVVGPAEGAVLEIAAGTGLNFPYYRGSAAVIATEPDIAILEIAIHRAKDAETAITLIAADAQALPFRAQTFDTVVVSLGLCTIPSPARALAEVRRVLRQRGVVRLLEHVRVDRPVAGRLQDILTPLWSRIAGGCRLNERTVETVRRAGFHIDEIRWHMRGLVVAIEACPAALGHER